MTGRCLLLFTTALLAAQTPSNLSEGRDAEKYMGRWVRALAPEFIRFTGLTEPGRILDYGASTGPLSLRLAARFRNAEIIGVDPNPALVAWAQIQSPRATVKFQSVPDMLRLPFSNGEFDAALSILTISQVQESTRALAELRRVTKPEGIIAAAVWDYGEAMQPLDVFWKAALALHPTLAPADGSGTPFSKKGQLADLWTTAGLRDVEEQPLDIQIEFRNFDDYWAPFLSGQGTAGAWLGTLKPEQRSALRENLRSRLIGSRPDGPFILHARAWAVRGVVRMAQ